MPEEIPPLPKIIRKLPFLPPISEERVLPNPSYVFGAEEPLVDFLAEAALEEDGFAALGTLDEELEILRVTARKLLSRPAHRER